MEGTILRSDVYTEILSGSPFDAVWIAADRRRGTGGDIISAEGWMACTAGAGAEKATQAAANTPAAGSLPAAGKDPNHAAHGTLNVFNPANAGYHPISVHLDLIQFFNGKRVI